MLRPLLPWQAHHMSTTVSEPDVAAHHEPSWRAGLKDGMPPLFGIAAWGMVVGVAMVKSGLSVMQALGMTLVVFAGSAQLAALPLIAAAAPIWVIFVTSVVVNLRFVIFAALMAPHFAKLPLLQRFLFGFGTGDLTTALYLQRFPSEAPEVGKLSYLRGLLYPNWFAWQAGSIAGIFLGSAVPAEWGLGFAGTLAIVCLAVPMVATRPALVGALVAAVTAVLAHALPYKLGLLAGVVVGMVTAMVVEGQIERRKAANV